MRNIFLAHAEFSCQPRVRLRFLDRVEICALQILDQRKLEHFEIARMPDDYRRLRQAGFLRRTPSSLTRDQLVSPVHLTNDQRLDDSMLPNRINQLLQCVALKFLARLERTRDDVGQAGLVNFLPGLEIKPRGHGPRTDQCTKTFTESRFRHLIAGYGKRSLHATFVGKFAKPRSAEYRVLFEIKACRIDDGGIKLVGK